MNVLPMSIYWPVATKASDLKPNAAHPDRLTVNGVSYGLTPAMAEGLFSCYQNLKRKAGRPKGSAVRFPGIKAFAAEQGVTPLHVYMVLTGRRHSRRVTEAWGKRNAV